MQKYKLRLDESVYIGDDERDVIAANRAGCISIFLKNENHRLKTEKAVLEVNDIEEAAEYIMQIGKEKMKGIITSITPLRISFTRVGVRT